MQRLSIFLCALSVLAQPECFRVSRNLVNIRDQPSTSGSKVVAQRPSGTILQSVGTKSQDGQWIQVSSSGQQGWVSLALVEKTTCSSTSPIPASSSSSCFEIQTSPVVLRATPSRTADRLGWLIKGWVVIDLNTKTSAEDLDWVKIRYGRVEGWTSSKNVAVGDCRGIVDRAFSGQTSGFGIELIRVMEGFVPNFYDDKGHQAIGYGFNCGFQDCSKIKAPITPEFGLTLLKTSVKSFENCVKTRFPGLTQRRFDVVVSFAYNLGCGTLDAPLLRAALQSKNWNAAAREFCKYVNALGKREAGLALRRSTEASVLIGSAINCDTLK